MPVSTDEIRADIADVVEGRYPFLRRCRHCRFEHKVDRVSMAHCRWFGEARLLVKQVCRRCGRVGVFFTYEDVLGRISLVEAEQVLRDAGVPLK